MGSSRSSILLVILTFGVLTSLLYTSFQLNYAPPHNPDTIPIEPKITQAQVIEIVERDYRKQVVGFQEAYLHFQYYNYSEGLEEDERYQQYLLTLAPGWNLSLVKTIPELLSLRIFFVHANSTVYSIDSDDHTYEKICEQPSIDCGISKIAGEASRDRLVYEVGAIVEGSAGYDTDVHHIIDAETGKLVYHIPYFDPRPIPHRLNTDDSRTIKEINHVIENAKFGSDIEIVQNASEIAQKENNLLNGYQPSDVRITMYNDTGAISVRWLNHDNIRHTVTSDDGYSDILWNRFDSGTIEPGGSYTFVFIEEGSHEYHCEIHPWMKGSIWIMPIYT